MNTKKSFSNKIGGFFGIIALSAMISSCQKDELLPVSPDKSVNSPTVKEAAVNPNVLPYEVIKINHIAARSNMPDYEVTVYSNMTALFEGRRNTATLGKKSFTVFPKTFFMVKNLFDDSHLFDHDIATNGGGYADLPEVLTTYTNGTGAVTLTDYNEPGPLYTLRTTAEIYLGIPDLVSHTDTDVK